MLLEECNALKSHCEQHGVNVGNTIELQDCQFTLNVNNFNFDEEEKDIMQWYKDFGMSYDEKLDTEIDHYEFLKYAIQHKISEVNYFFPSTTIDTCRKYIIFSADCISMIHIVVRKDSCTMNVYMRSSDLIRLLPMDLLHLCRIFQSVQERHNIKKNNNEINLHIASLHMYV